MKEKEIEEKLREILKDDIRFDSGRIIGTMCTKPHKIASKYFKRFLDVNIGDPGLFPGVSKMEGDVIRWLGRLLGNENAVGNLVSGGSEANFLAIYCAKKYRSDVKNPEMIASASAHVSIKKACDMMGIKLVTIPLDSRFMPKVEIIEKKVNENTIGIVGIAGTTSLGLIEPIEMMSEVALENDLYLHVDAAFGGLVIPFMRMLGYKLPDFDFKLKGVKSITVDPHKMGMSVIPSGGILFRDEELKRMISFKVSYLSGGETYQSTITGTRPGASVISTWALFRYLGVEGYKKVVERCIRLTEFFFDEVKEIKGLEPVTKPVMNIVGIRPTSIPCRELEMKLRERRWGISSFGEFLRVVIGPHVKKKDLELFLKDVSDILS
ncbi:MAG: tyrosine decarboxylase MfnA [Candidatus Asgardarchaeia archaeon]